MISTDILRGEKKKKKRKQNEVIPVPDCDRQKTKFSPAGNFMSEHAKNNSSRSRESF